MLAVELIERLGLEEKSSYPGRLWIKKKELPTYFMINFLLFVTEALWAVVDG